MAPGTQPPSTKTAKLLPPAKPCSILTTHPSWTSPLANLLLHPPIALAAGQRHPCGPSISRSARGKRWGGVKEDDTHPERHARPSLWSQELFCADK